MKKGFIDEIIGNEAIIIFEDNSKKIIFLNELSPYSKADDIIVEENGKFVNKSQDRKLYQAIKKLVNQTTILFKKETKPLRLGVIGPGKIAHTVCKNLKIFPAFEFEAVASRDINKAIAFQKEYGFKKAYEGYESLLKDPAVDLVYIATPHAFHYEQMKQAISFHKNILCEKAFCLELDQVKEIYALAKEKNLFVGEALVPAFLPSLKIIKNVIQSGKIGKIKHATAVFGANIKAVPRVIQKELGGGAMYDIGIYPLYFFYFVFGNKATINNVQIKWENQVDVVSSFELIYEDFQASVVASVEEDLGMHAWLEGETGFIHIENIARPEKIIIYNNSKEVVETIDQLRQTSGYEFEFLAAKQAIDDNKIQTSNHSHQASIKLYEWIMEVLSHKE